MSKAINDIKNRTAKLRALTGVELCTLVEALDSDATEKEFVDAWNVDAGIIAGMINDMELEATTIDLEDYYD